MKKQENLSPLNLNKWDLICSLKVVDYKSSIVQYIICNFIFICICYIGFNLLLDSIHESTSVSSKRRWERI